MHEMPLDVVEAYSPASPASPRMTEISTFQRLIGSSRKKNQAASTRVKHIHQQGITGINLALPYFDGSSKNADDHFIDLDTDSMEREPDVRVYFWHVGQEVLDVMDVPVDRVDFDSLLVRTGREWLRDYRDKGCGMFLSPKDRRNELNNEPGATWFRMPTIAICEGIADGSIAALENECGFYDTTPTEEYNDRTICLLPTNIRVPMWWAESLKDGVIPGTLGWDDAIEQAYTESRHPGHAIYDNIVGRDEMILNLVRLGSSKAPFDTSPTDRQKADKVLLRDWPKLRLPYRRSQDCLIMDSNLQGDGFLQAQGITVDQFLGRT